MAGLSENMEALKHGFFFRGFFSRRGYFNLDDISPRNTGRGADEGQKPTGVARLAAL